MIYNRSLFLSMKNLKKQPQQQTTYKDFIEQLRLKQNNQTGNKKDGYTTPVCKSNPSNMKKINLAKQSVRTPHTQSVSQAQNNSQAQKHSQSTSIWDKSISRGKIKTESSLENNNKNHQLDGPNRNTHENKQMLSNKDRALSYHRFISESTYILTEILKLESTDLLTHKISYIEFLEALKALKLIYDNYEPYPNDIISELWTEFISAENVGNFIITVSSILGLYFEGKQTQNDRYIRRKYESLKYTRMELYNRRGEEDNFYQVNDCTFIPQISERSRKLATSRNKKVTTSNSKSKQKNCHLTDRFHPSHSQSKNGVTSVYEYDENSCLNTQRPQPYYQNNIKYQHDKTGNRRSQILYHMGKQKSMDKLKNRSINDIEYEKNAKQLTFKPKIINRSKQKLGKCKVKGEQNTVSRMIKGRVEREVRKIINDKGLPYNEKIVDKMKRQKYQEILSSTAFQTEENSQEFETSETKEQSNLPPPPYKQFEAPVGSSRGVVVPEQDLVIDVYISEEHKEKLVIRKGQSLQDTASDFIRQHGLSLQKKDQLVQLLQVSLFQALSPIDELAEEEEQEILSARNNNIRGY